MYKLYFQDKAIVIDNDAAKYASASVAFVSPGDAVVRPTNLLQKIQNTKQQVWITDDVEALYRAVIDAFPSIEAAGGLVENAAGELLMIFRYTRWDLPKGKLEPGERIEDCAVREVEEETGITAPERGEKLAVTTHFYRLDGEWTAKKTTWYKMKYKDSEPLVPQLEEDITAIEWVNPAKLDAYLRTSYPTIVDVFAAAGFRV